MELNEQNKNRIQALKLQMLMDIDKEASLEQVKPDWITDEQWKANPNIYHWEQEKKGAESQAKLPPVTPEEALAQTIRLRNEKNWKDRESL